MADEFNDLGLYESKKSANETIQSSVKTKEVPVSDHSDKVPKLTSTTKNLKKGASGGRWKQGSFKSTKSYSDKENFKKEKAKASKKGQEKSENRSKPTKFNKNKDKTLIPKKESKKAFIKKQAKRKSKSSALTSGSGSKGELAESNEQTNWTDDSKRSYDSGKEIVDQAKKRFNFAKKQKKFGSGVEKNARESSIFGNRAKEATREVGKVVDTTKYINPTLKTPGLSVSNIGKQLSKLASEVLSPKALALKFLAIGGGIVALVGLLLICGLFITNLISGSQQQSNPALTGVTYVKNWDGEDAYHSSFLAQRYGITAEQIDGFIKSEGFADKEGFDSRSSGKEFLKLQAQSGIDVRTLVAFAQMESSFATNKDSVAYQYKKANLFGYGSFDDDPDQGASWDNSRAVDNFRSNQIDGYGNSSLYICDLRAAAYHAGALKPGEAVYWSEENSGVKRAKVEEAFNDYINKHGGTPEPPGGYGPADHGGGGGLAALDKMMGQVITGEFGGETGQCYAVSAYYAHGINSKIILRGGTAASDIGSDYDWKGWGWTVVNNPKYSDIKVGDIINFKRGANMGTWNTDSENGHTAVVGKILGGNKLLIYDQNPSPLRTWTYTYNSGVASVIHPPK